MSSKYAALPDLDSSQDIYETPDLTDDVSTLPVSNRGPQTTTSIPDDDSHENDSVDGSGLVTEHLQPTSARGRFKHSEIDARGVDFSDRISGKRRSYRASSRRRRRRGGGSGGYEDEAGDEDGYDSEELYGEETLAMRVARLRREIEEVRAEAAASGGESGDDEGEEGEGERMEVKAGIVELSDALESLQIQSPEERGAQAKLAKKLVGSLSVLPGPTPTEPTEPTETTAEPNTTTTSPATTTIADPTPAHTTSYTITYAPTFKHTHALAKAADFDTRLSVLEKCIGMPTSALSDHSRPLPTSSIIPTLDELSRQMSVLTSSSTSSLDAASRRVRQLTQEAEKLAEARKAAKAAADARAAEDAAAGEDAAAAAAAAVAGDGAAGGARDAKINALYGALPTIEGMGPMLPAVLDRLRSLRAIHADAGRAVEALARVERRQEEMAAEVARWREALVKVEGAVGESRATVGANMKEVEGWVRELEARCGVVEGLEKGV
ncbi:Dynamitin-domain-containing protein [Morchella snyderi]|nr:Dynamitin-domain-containing protein [Morchella snyderi]